MPSKTPRPAPAGWNRKAAAAAAARTKKIREMFARWRRIGTSRAEAVRIATEAVNQQLKGSGATMAESAAAGADVLLELDAAYGPGGSK